MRNFSPDETMDDSLSGFKAKVEVDKQADMFAVLAKEYFAMFGLTNETIIRQSIS